MTLTFLFFRKKIKLNCHIKMSINSFDWSIILDFSLQKYILINIYFAVLTWHLLIKRHILMMQMIMNLAVFMHYSIIYQSIIVLWVIFVNLIAIIKCGIGAVSIISSIIFSTKFIQTLRHLGCWRVTRCIGIYWWAV